MSCNPELVSAFLDGELDDIIVDSVAQHLIKCDGCCRTLSLMAQVRDAVAGRLAIRDPERLTASIMAAISGEGGTVSLSISNENPLQQRLVRFGVPAALAAAALAGWLHGQQGKAQLADAQGKQAMTERYLPLP